MSENTATETRFADLVDFVRKEIAEFTMPVTRSTLIEDDLGVTGDDAEELIVAFSKKYSVDINDFLFTKYFYDEVDAISFFPGKVVHPFTIGHLEKAIIAGKLNEEVING